MALSTSQQVSFFQAPPVPVEQLFALAQDGDREALAKIVDRKDYVITGTMDAVDTVAVIDIPRAALGLDVTSAVVHIKARIFQTAATPTAAALCSSEAVAMYANIAGTLTVAATTPSVAYGAVLGAASQAGGLFAVSTTFVRLSLDPGAATAQNFIVFLEVTKIQ